MKPQYRISFDALQVFKCFGAFQVSKSFDILQVFKYFDALQVFKSFDALKVFNSFDVLQVFKSFEEEDSKKNIYITKVLIIFVLGITYLFSIMSCSISHIWQ